MTDRQGDAGRWGLDRRQVLAGLGLTLGAAAAAAPRAWAQTRPPAEAAALRTLLADLEPDPLAPGTARFLRFSGIDEDNQPPMATRDDVATAILDETPDDALDLTWPSDNDAPDYRHFDGPASRATVEIDHAALERAAARNAFVITGERVLVGLRGATLMGEAAGAILIQESRPSFTHPGCVIALWRRDAQTVTALQGATTPAALATLIQSRLRNAGRVAHLTPTGLYTAAVGAHRPGSAEPEPGAFLIEDPVIPLRSFRQSADGAAYTVTDSWDFDHAGPLTALHAAEIPAGLAPEARFRGLGFSSAGGATAPGGYDRSGPAPLPTGPWAVFREAAGLAARPTVNPDDFATSDDGQRFPFLLLTGRDVRLAVSEPGEAPELRRLRFGSQGDGVRGLQDRLNVSQTGVFDRATQAAFLTFQLEGDGTADGILSPTYARNEFRNFTF